MKDYEKFIQILNDVEDTEGDTVDYKVEYREKLNEFAVTVEYTSWVFHYDSGKLYFVC